MAYTVPNRKLIRPWEKNGRKRYRIYTATLKVGTTIAQVATGGGVTAGTTGVANAVIPFRGPGRIVGVQYGVKSAPDTYGAATGGALTVKAETTAGVQIFTDADLTSVKDGFVPVGTTAVDEARGVTAATDAFSGGFPVRGGVFVAIASGTDGEVVTVDFLVRHTTYARCELYPVGAAGSATVSSVLRLGGPGVLSAIAVDFGASVPATADLTVTADDASTGTALFTSTNSATDLAPSLIGSPGADEAIAATAATDGTEAASGFKDSLIVKLDQGDPGSTAGNTSIVELWIDD